MAMRSAANESGFTLPEALVALSVLVTAALGVAHSFVLAIRANDRARSMAMTTILAAEQLDRLRALPWYFDAAGTRITDVDTDLTRSPEQAAGRGLRPSPSDALERNVPGYYDFLDRTGLSIGNGTSPPADTAYVRRWLIEPLATHPLDGLVLHVRVLPALGAASSDRPAVGEARVSTIRARRAR
jgi:type II secretory pathway pseudopilin PulG